MKKTILFLISFVSFLSFVQSLDAEINYQNKIQNNLSIPQIQKEYFNKKINLLKNKYALYRSLTYKIDLNPESFYILTTNLPLSAKLINHVCHNRYYIEKINEYKFYADDSVALEGDVYRLENQLGSVFFYGEGKVNFLFNDYDFMGSLYVEYFLDESDSLTLQVEIMVYPNNIFARSVFKLLMSLGFKSYADKKIATIYRKVNKTARKLKKRPSFFLSLVKDDQFAKKFHITQPEREILAHLIESISTHHPRKIPKKTQP